MGGYSAKPARKEMMEFLREAVKTKRPQNLSASVEAAIRKLKKQNAKDQRGRI